MAKRIIILGAAVAIMVAISLRADVVTTGLGGGGGGVSLQTATPGTAQAGNFNVTGTGIVGALTAGTPIGQASGGTGAGALTCPAGQFLTSNGASYSCSAPPAAGFAYYGPFSSAATTVAAIPGSLCSTVAVTTTLIGNTANFGCLASTNAAWGTNALTVTCEMSGGSQCNVRICNTGTNTNTPPASTVYTCRIFN